MAIVLDLTFPHHQRPPTSFSDSSQLHGITRDITRELQTPKTTVGFWNGRPSASLVLVPETPVNEDRLLPTWESNVRFAGQIAAMEPEAKT
jgi:hypothetical protein